jgi:hypothetical protein
MPLGTVLQNSRTDEENEGESIRIQQIEEVIRQTKNDQAEFKAKAKKYLDGLEENIKDANLLREQNLSPAEQKKLTQLEGLIRYKEERLKKIDPKGKIAQYEKEIAEQNKLLHQEKENQTTSSIKPR